VAIRVYYYSSQLFYGYFENKISKIIPIFASELSKLQIVTRCQKYLDFTNISINKRRINV